MGSPVKIVIVAVALAAVLVGLALAVRAPSSSHVSGAVRARPLPAALPEAENPAPARLPTAVSPAAPSAPEVAPPAPVKPRPLFPETRFGAADDGLRTADAALDGALDAASLADIAPGQSQVSPTGGLLHAVDPAERLGSVPQALPELGERAPPRMAQSLDQLRPLFTAQGSLDISQTNRLP